MKRFGIQNAAPWHAISIGDQPGEREACKSCCSEYNRRVRRRSLCKTLTLAKEPTIEELTDTLTRLAPRISRLVSLDSDEDYTTNFLKAVVVQAVAPLVVPQLQLALLKRTATARRL